MISGDALEVLIDVGKFNTISTNCIVKSLEAFCDLAGVSIERHTLFLPEFTEIAKGYLGALASDDFYGISYEGRRKLAWCFQSMYAALHPKSPPLESRFGGADYYHPYLKTWEKIKSKASEETFRYWNGWEVISKKGKSSYLAIPMLWNAFGIDFAEMTYHNYKLHIELQARIENTLFADFIKYICRPESEWNAASFQDPIKIRNIFQGFMLEWFTSAAEANQDLYTRSRVYGKFINLLQVAFVQSGIWAKPFLGELPAPRLKKSSSSTHIKQLQDGSSVNDKLITQIPLHITDSEAIELLFSTIKSDVNLTFRWAKKKSHALRRVQLQRDYLALIGTPLSPNLSNKEFAESLTPENVAATLNTHGLGYLRNRIDSLPSNWSLSKTSLLKYCALPGIYDIMPFKFLLVHAHQNITESFIDYLELYDKSNRLSGFLKTDNGYQLVGYKDRRGATRSEIKIDLTAREAVWVRQVIRITTPLREELKAAGDDSWRYLCLHSARALTYPNISKTTNFSSRMSADDKSELARELSKLCNKTNDQINQFISRLTLTSFRATRAIDLYIKNRSEEQLSKSLGHAQYHPGLLSSYLPEPIIDFLQCRWIKIFQRGVVCKALEGSEHLLKATNFRNIEELNEFMLNHSLRDIPHHLYEATDILAGDESTPDILVVSVNTEILTALLSFEKSCSSNSAAEPPSGLVKFWSEFSSLLSQEIERGWNDDLKLCLTQARKTLAERGLKQ